MNTEKIEIQPGQYVWVDTETVCETGELYLTHIRKIIKPKEKGVIQAGDKIIAASPELELEGVPDYVEWLAEQELNNDLDLYESLIDGHIRHGFGINIIKMLFIKGYQTAEQEMFTEEDLKKAVELARLQFLNLYMYEPEQIIEQIKSEKK